MMAEGRGIEPLSASQRSLDLASRRNATLPAFRVVASAGVEPASCRSTGECMPPCFNAEMVGQVGVEPTKSPRSERGAFANLTTARWCRRADSNRHYAASQTADSTNWPTSANGGSAQIRTEKLSRLERDALPFSYGPVAESEGLEPPAVSPVTVFGTARPACRPTLRSVFSCTSWVESYDSRNADRLRSDRYDSGVSRKARVIDVADSIAQEVV